MKGKMLYEKKFPKFDPNETTEELSSSQEENQPHIYRRFKNKQLIIISEMRKAVFCIRTFNRYACRRSP